jgi:hypothetical protein
MAPVKRRRDDRGQVAIELVGALPYLILGALAVLQLTFAVSVVQSVSAAARAGARAESQGDGADAAARAAVPGWMQGALTVSVGGGQAPSVSVSSSIPIVLPGVAGPTVTRRAWFEPEQGPSPWG